LPLSHVRFAVLRVSLSSHVRTTYISILSLHDALPICAPSPIIITMATARMTALLLTSAALVEAGMRLAAAARVVAGATATAAARSEEHTSELQSRENLVCRLLLEKKKENLTQRQKRRK